MEGLKTKQDLIKYLDDFYLQKNYVKPAERKAKLDGFSGMFRSYEDAILVACFEYWFENFSSKLGAGKDFFDDLSRFKEICDDEIRRIKNQWQSNTGTGFRRQPTRQFHNAIVAIPEHTHKDVKNENWKPMGDVLKIWYDKTYVAPAIKQHNERKEAEMKEQMKGLDDDLPF